MIGTRKQASGAGAGSRGMHMSPSKLLRILAVGLFLALFAVPALAQERRGGRHRRSVPEFDPAAAGVVAALVAGGGVLLSRRKKK